MDCRVSDAKRAEGVIVLVSGGVDSTVLLYQQHAQAQSRGTRVVPLFLDYAQRAAPLEQRATAWHCRRLGLSLHTLDLAPLGESFRRREVLKRHIPLPHRNLIALSVALSYLEIVGCNALALGVIQDDLDGYPSASLDFFDSFRALASTLGTAQIETPFVGWSKVAVVAEGRRLGVDFSYTYSCMLGREKHCGRCGQCQKRVTAIELLA